MTSMNNIGITSRVTRVVGSKSLSPSSFHARTSRGDSLSQDGCSLILAFLYWYSCSGRKRFRTSRDDRVRRACPRAIGLRDCYGLRFAAAVRNKRVRTLRLAVGIGLREQDQHDSDRREHAEG